MYDIPAIQSIETNFIDHYQKIQPNFDYYNGYRNNCSRVVKKFLASIGVNTQPITPWADTIRKVGPVHFNSGQIRSGDILAMGRPGNTFHVGVYLGDDIVLHQSSSRGYKVGAFKDLTAFTTSGHGFYFVRPSYSNQQILEDQFYISPEIG